MATDFDKNRIERMNIYEKLFELSQYLVCVAGLDGYFKHVNPAWTDVLGYDFEELLHKPFIDLIHPDDHAKNEAELAYLASGGKTTDFVNRYFHKDGSIRIIEWRATPDKEGKFIHCIGRDITRQKHANDALKESERKFRTLVDQSADMLLLHDIQGNIVDVNETSIQQYGYTRDQLLNMKLYDLDPDYIEREEGGAFWDRMEFNEPVRFEARQRRKDGTIFPVEVILTKIMIQDETFVMGLCRDITERKQAEEALRKSEERFRNLYDDAPVGYFEYDIQGNITQVNRTELEMLGYSAEEMIGQPCWKFIVDEAAREQILAKLAGTRPPAAGLERTYRRKDGTTFPVLFEDRVLTDENGHITGIRTAIQDITERKRAEEQRNKLITELQKTLSEVKTLRGFLPICSHCKKIRDDKGYWNQIESYIHKHSDAEFSHGICPECAQKYYPDMDLYGDEQTKE